MCLSRVCLCPQIAALPHGAGGDGASGVAFDSAGACLLLGGRDGCVRVLDARAAGGAVAFGAGPAEAHAGGRCRAAALGRPHEFITTGLDARRRREAAVWDARCGAGRGPVARYTGEVLPGPWAPLVDADTGCVYLWARGEARVSLVDVRATGDGARGGSAVARVRVIFAVFLYLYCSFAARVCVATVALHAMCVPSVPALTRRGSRDRRSAHGPALLGHGPRLRADSVTRVAAKVRRRAPLPPPPPPPH